MSGQQLTLAEKRQQFDELVVRLRRKNMLGIGIDFKYDVLHACDWCRITFNLYDVARVDSCLVVCEDRDDPLKLLGTDETTTTWLAQRHPHKSCAFVEGRLQHLIFLNEEKYNNETQENKNLSDYILKKGLQDQRMIQEIICDFVQKNVKPALSKDIMKNQTIPLMYPFTKTTTEDQMDRFIVYYRAFRRHILQDSKIPLNDVGTVVLRFRYCKFQGEADMSVCTREGDWKYIQFVLPSFYYTHNFCGLISQEERSRNCYHTELKIEHILTFAEKLRAFFNVKMAFKTIPMASICKCRIKAEPELNETPYPYSYLPKLPRPGKVLPTTAPAPVRYEAPRGLKGLCVSAMRHSWHWKAMDVDGVLPDKLADYYFGSGEMNSSPVGF